MDNNTTATRSPQAAIGLTFFGMLISIVGLALFPRLAGVLSQAAGIWTLLPYLLMLTAAMLALWSYLARLVRASEAASPVEPDSVLT